MSAETTTTQPAGTGDARAAGWWRVGYMILFVIAFSLVQTLHTLFAAVQALAIVILREPNPHLAAFGAGLAEWTRQTSRFLTCADETKPWPFSPWPDARD